MLKILITHLRTWLLPYYPVEISEIYMVFQNFLVFLHQNRFCSNFQQHQSNLDNLVQLPTTGMVHVRTSEALKAQLERTQIITPVTKRSFRYIIITVPVQPIRTSELAETSQNGPRSRDQMIVFCLPPSLVVFNTSSTLVFH